MTAPARETVYVTRSPFWLPRLLFLIAAVCAFIAAFEFSGVLHGGLPMGWAWLAGAASAFALAWAVP
jgi:hypothetical protein